MRNLVTKLIALAAAVLVVIAGITGVALWTHTGSGIALVDVLTQVQQATAYMCQTATTIRGKGPADQDMNETIEGTMLVAPDYGMKMSTGSVDPNGEGAGPTEMYVLVKEKTAIMLMPGLKHYTRMELDDTLIEKYRQQNSDPGAILKQVLGSTYESLGRSTVDGVDVDGFQTTEPDYPGGPTSRARTKIWVDVKTKLPVRLEHDGDVSGMQMHTVLHDFQWNYPMDANTFKVVIPPDYTTPFGGDLKMPAMDEQGAIAGLKVCAELTGRYPERLDSTTITSMMREVRDKDDPAFPPVVEEEDEVDAALSQASEEDDKDLLAFKQLLKENKNLSPEELINKTNELISKFEERMKKVDEQLKARQEQHEKGREQAKKTMEGRVGDTVKRFMPIQGTVMFYMTLAGERKDPAYYGNVVALQDADKVLMRWKISDNQYRVIFGSLRAETVDGATLAELEKDLAK